MGKDNLPLGGKPNQDRGPNLLKQTAAKARKQTQTLNQMQAQALWDFGDGSTMFKDWTVMFGIIDQVLKQKLEICWAIALTRLLQAIYNITRDKIADHKTFVHEDLVAHLKLKKKKETRATSMKLENLRDAIDHIANKGLLKKKSSGFTKAGSEVGFHGKWNFSMAKCPSVDFIKAKVDISPVVLSFEITSDFSTIENSIYKISGVELETDQVAAHAVLIVGYGYTKEGRLFFLIQNSWGEDWAVKGYGRIFIDDESKITIVYPEVT